MKIRNENRSPAAFRDDETRRNETQIQIRRRSNRAHFNANGNGNGELQNSRDSVLMINKHKSHWIAWDWGFSVCFLSASASASAAKAKWPKGRGRGQRLELEVGRRCRLAITLIAYLLWVCKLRQLCLVIVLLLPFLINSTAAVIQTETAGSGGGQSQNILYPLASPADSQQQQQQLTHLQTGFARLINANAESFSQNRNQNQSETKTKTKTKTNDKSQQQFYNKSNTNTNTISNANSLIILSHNSSSSQLVPVPVPVRNRRADNYHSQYKASSKHGRYNRSIDKARLTKLVMSGLGLKKLPDMRKANISQLEYTSKYLEYLQRLENQQRHNSNDNSHLPLPELPLPPALHIFSIVTNNFSDITDQRWSHRHRHRRTARAIHHTKRQRQQAKNKSLIQNGDKMNILLHFPLSLNDAHFQSDSIDEANVRLMLLYSSSLAVQRWALNKKRQQQQHHKLNGQKSCGDLAGSTFDSGSGSKSKKKSRSLILNLKVYQLLSANKRQLLDARKLEFENSEETRSQWLEFDVTKAVRGWLNKSHENLGIEIQCDKCRRLGARILSDASSSKSSAKSIDEDNDDRYQLMPVLNIIGRLGHTHREGGVHQINSSANQTSHLFRHRADQTRSYANSCYKVHQRCCRHQLNVAFKDIKGFEFIIHPKVFDAGYCQGRCPPRHNPAHHHALLQSLIWQQDHSRAPRPCCAPSKLTALEILHMDEEHSDQLKISTWSDMEVVECACS